MSWQDLKDLFKSVAHVVRANIVLGDDGRSKGSGIVLYETDEDAQEAIGNHLINFRQISWL